MHPRRHLSRLALRVVGLILAAPLVLGNAGSNVLVESLMRMVCGAPECTLLHCGSSESSGCCKHEPAGSHPSVDDQRPPCDCCFIDPLPEWPDNLPAPGSTASAAEIKKAVVSLLHTPFWNQLAQGSLLTHGPPRVAGEARARSSCPWSPGRNAAKGSRISAVLGRALI